MHDTRTHDVVYTEAMVRDAVKTFVWRRGVIVRKGLWIADGLAMCALVWANWSCGTVWLFNLLAALPLCLIALMWIVHTRNTVGKFRRMRYPVATIAFEDEGLSTSSDLGRALIPWSTISEIWERPGYWMLFTAPNQFMTLPIETVPLADRDFLRSKVAADCPQP